MCSQYLFLPSFLCTSFLMPKAPFAKLTLQLLVACLLYLHSISLLLCSATLGLSNLSWKNQLAVPLWPPVKSLSIISKYKKYFHPGCCHSIFVQWDGTFNQNTIMANYDHLSQLFAQILVFWTPSINNMSMYLLPMTYFVKHFFISFHFRRWVTGFTESSQYWGRQWIM